MSKTYSELLLGFPDNDTGDIKAHHMRALVESVTPYYMTVYASDFQIGAGPALVTRSIVEDASSYNAQTNSFVWASDSSNDLFDFVGVGNLFGRASLTAHFPLSDAPNYIRVAAVRGGQQVTMVYDSAPVTASNRVEFSASTIAEVRAGDSIRITVDGNSGTIGSSALLLVQFSGTTAIRPIGNPGLAVAGG